MHHKSLQHTSVDILPGDLCNRVSYLVPHRVDLLPSKSFQQFGPYGTLGIGTEAEEEFFGLVGARDLSGLGGLFPKQDGRK